MMRSFKDIFILDVEMYPSSSVKYFVNVLLVLLSDNKKYKLGTLISKYLTYKRSPIINGLGLLY